VYAVGVALLAAGMFFSLVRGTWITTSLTLLIIMVIGSRYRPQIRYAFPLFLVVVVACLSGITFLLGQDQIHLIVNRLSTLSTLSIDGGNSNLARIDLAGRILRIIPEHPFGVGVANIRFYLVDFPFGAVNHAENVFLQLCVEQGIFGVAIFSYLLVWILSRLGRFVRDTNLRPEEAWVGWALLGIVINWLLYGLFNLMIDSMWYWLVMSLAVSLCNLTEREMLRYRRMLATCVPPTLIQQNRSANP
jgi:O-antigen ligase